MLLIGKDVLRRKSRAIVGDCAELELGEVEECLAIVVLVNQGLYLLFVTPENNLHQVMGFEGVLESLILVRVVLPEVFPNSFENVLAVVGDFGLVDCL